MPSVTRYLDRQPNKRELVASAKHIATLGLGESSEIKVQSCGDYTSAKIYSPAESIRVFKLSRAPEVDNMPLLKNEYVHFVKSHHNAVQRIREEAGKRSYKRLRLSVLSW